MKNGWRWYRGRPLWMQIVLGVVAAVILLSIIGAFTSSDDKEKVATEGGSAPVALGADVSPTVVVAATGVPAAATTPAPTPVPTPARTSAPTPLPTPAPTPGLSANAPLAPGSRIKVGSAIITLNGIVDPFISTNQFSKPKAGDRWVTIDVTITNDGTGEYSFNSLFDWKAKDADAFTYGADISASSAASPFLSTGKLAAKGDQARGVVGFAIKEGAVLKTVQFQSISSTNQGKFE